MIQEYIYFRIEGKTNIRMNIDGDTLYTLDMKQVRIENTIKLLNKKNNLEMDRIISGYYLEPAKYLESVESIIGPDIPYPSG